MKTEEKVLRVGTAAILLALVLRIFGAGLWNDLVKLKESASIPSILLYAATGKVFSPAYTDSPDETTPPETTLPPDLPVFAPADGASISVKNYPEAKFDLTALLQKPLTWQLQSTQPTVLIFHSHACESYENTEGYTPSAFYRTTDTRYNMVSVGAHLAQCLREKGIGVIHDTTLHDSPSYNDAYKRSRQTVVQYLEKYPSIQLVLDIHRDAYEDGNGNQASNTLSINGTKTAKLMFLTGSNAHGHDHPNWQDNLSVALKLQATLEKEYPGICRNITLRSDSFNQELSTGFLLVEVGTAGDTRQSALAAAECLAEAIAILANGSN